MSDAAPSDDQSRRIFQIPRVIVALFAVMAAIQAAESLVSEEAWDRFLTSFAFVPLRFTNGFDPQGVAAAIGDLSEPLRSQALFLLGDGKAHLWTMLTYAFVHGGWEHLLVNSVWLVAFGAPVARRIGGGPFFTLFCAASVGGALAQWAIDPYGADLLVGASAGISGIVAAAARFVFLPGGPLGVYRPDDGEPAPRAASVMATLRDSRAMIFVALWMIANVLFGYLAEPMGLSPAPVAWQAHIGGFIVGFLFFSVFDRPQGHRATAGD